MGLKRNGAATWVKYIQLACKLSHLPGFKGGLDRMIGVTNSDNFYSLWTPLCEAIELYTATDDWPFKKDVSGGEPQDIDLGP